MPEQNSTQQEILNIALQEFTQKGFTGVRLKAIAEQTNVTKAMIHYYFDTKEKLFKETYRSVSQELMNDLFEPLEANNSLFAKLDALIDHILDRFKFKPAKAQFLVNELNCQPEITEDIFKNTFNCDLSSFNTELKEAADNYEIAPVSADHVLTNILSLCIFPYSGQTFTQCILKKDDKAFQNLLEQQEEVIKDTILNWLTA